MGAGRKTTTASYDSAHSNRVPIPPDRGLQAEVSRVAGGGEAPQEALRCQSTQTVADALVAACAAGRRHFRLQRLHTHRCGSRSAGLSERRGGGSVGSH